MSIAINKLEEAEFFLKKTKETKGKGTEFQYYFSALMSAAASIKYTIEKEFKGMNRIEFQRWWKKRERDLRGKEEYKFVHGLNKGRKEKGWRGTLLHEGNIIAYIFESNDNRNNLGALEFVYVPASGLEKICIIPPDRLKKFKRYKGESGSDFKERCIKHVWKIIDKLDVGQRDINLMGYSLQQGKRRYTFDQLVAINERYLCTMRRVVCEAINKFRIKK